MSNPYPMLPAAPTPSMPFSFYPPAPSPIAGPFTFNGAMGNIGSLAGNGANGVLGRAATLLPGASPASTLASQAVSGAGTATRMPGEVRFASQLGRAVGGGGGSGGLGRMLGGVNLTKAAGMRALGFAGAGMLGSSLADKYTPGSHNSNAEQGLQGAALGAGTGAAIGSVVPVLGTAAGALAGGAIGGAIGVLGNTFGWGGGDDDKKEIVPEDVIANAIMVAQLDEATSDEIMVGYDTLMALAGQYEEGSDERKAAEASALDQVGQMVLGAVGQRDQVSSDASNTLALQSQARDIFEPLASSIEASSAMYGQAMQGIRSSLPESMRGIADYQTAQQLSSGNRLANAYRAQAAITPAIDALTRYQQDADSFARQQFAQMMAQQAAGGGTSMGPSTTDVQALLAASG